MWLYKYIIVCSIHVHSKPQYYTTDSNNFPRCMYTGFSQIYAYFCLNFVMKIFHLFQSSFFFHHTQSERDIFFCYRSMTLQTSIWCRGCSLSLIASSYIPLEWPVWQCLIECNFHLYHGFLHVHFFKVTVFNESHLNNTEWYLSTASVSVLAFAINLIRNFKFPRHLFNEVDKLVCLMG